MKHVPPHLTPLGLWLIAAGFANGADRTAMAKAFGITVSALGGAHRRHVRGLADTRNSTDRGRDRKETTATARSGTTWEAALTEPWSVFSARKKAERAAARASG